jgi:hypothetical protein
MLNSYGRLAKLSISDNLCSAWVFAGRAAPFRSAEGRRGGEAGTTELPFLYPATNGGGPPVVSNHHTVGCPIRTRTGFPGEFTRWGGKRTGGKLRPYQALSTNRLPDTPSLAAQGSALGLPGLYAPHAQARFRSAGGRREGEAGTTPLPSPPPPRLPGPYLTSAHPHRSAPTTARASAETSFRDA